MQYLLHGHEPPATHSSEDSLVADLRWNAAKFSAVHIEPPFSGMAMADKERTARHTALLSPFTWAQRGSFTLWQSRPVEAGRPKVDGTAGIGRCLNDHTLQRRCGLLLGWPACS